MRGVRIPVGASMPCIVRTAGMLLAGVLAILPVPRSDARMRPVTTGPPSDRPARGKLVVATAGVEDTNFAHSVVLLVAYAPDEGAMGVIVNQPLDVPIARVLPDVAPRRDHLWRGGPILPTSLLTLLRGPKDVADSELLFADVRMVTSREAFERAMKSSIPAKRLRAFAGHAGWAPGQLEKELARGDWALMPATADIVFAADPTRVWPALMQRRTGEWTRRPSPLRVALAR
jgi:putative transcriptional regulator